MGVGWVRNQRHRSDLGSSEDQRPRRRHLQGIDGLRALAALSVLADHVGEHVGKSAGSLGTLVSYGAQGLTLFFALSGFLLFLPFVAAVLADRPGPSLRRYFSNRVLRIYPAYLVIFIIINFVLAVGLLHGTKQLYPRGNDLGRITSPTTLMPDLSLVQSLVPHALGTGIGPAWSLTAELTFYFLLPFLSLLAVYLVRERIPKALGLLVPPILLIATGLITTVAIKEHLSGKTASQLFTAEWGHSATSVIVRSFLGQADLFGWGMLAAIVFEYARRKDFRRIGDVPRAAILTIVVLITGLALREGGNFTSNIIGVCAGILILLVALPGKQGEPGRLAQLLEWSPIKYIGLISYSIYLWHEPMIYFLQRHGILKGSGAGTLAVDLLIVLAIVLALASTTYYLIEKPAMSLRGTLPSRTTVI
jgi:peptidoglycan/LPS O-acetylase OafA/YrhL